MLNLLAAMDRGIQSFRISQASEQLNTNEMIPATAFQKRGSFVWNMGRCWPGQSGWQLDRSGFNAFQKIAPQFLILFIQSVVQQNFAIVLNTDLVVQGGIQVKLNHDA